MQETKYKKGIIREVSRIRAPNVMMGISQSGLPLYTIRQAARRYRMISK
jgi:hypothetical protein